MNYTYYEVEAAVFRMAKNERMEVYARGGWWPYDGDEFRVRRLSNPLTLAEVWPYMDRVKQPAAK